MMKTLVNTRSIRNTLISAVAVSALTLPLIASASVNSNPADNESVSLENAEQVSLKNAENQYAKLQDAARKICGSSNIRITGSIQRSVGIEECYDGTLTAAVERADSAAITAQHEK